MNLKHTLLIMLFFAPPSFSNELEDTQRFINNLIDNPIPTESLHQAQGASSRPSNDIPSVSQEWVNQLKRPHSSPSRPKPKAIYFVSFSIPEDGLKRLILDADLFGIPTTIRGMVNNDMRDTANAVLRLVGEDKRGGVQIDPKSFSVYGVNAVPALIVTCGDKFDRIAGNISIKESLMKISKSGDCSDTARLILSTHHK